MVVVSILKFTVALPSEIILFPEFASFHSFESGGQNSALLEGQSRNSPEKIKRSTNGYRQGYLLLSVSKAHDQREGSPA